MLVTRLPLAAKVAVGTIHPPLAAAYKYKAMTTFKAMMLLLCAQKAATYKTCDEWTTMAPPLNGAVNHAPALHDKAQAIETQTSQVKECNEHPLANT